MNRSNEPIAWSLFGAGGMILAFLAPAMIVISGFLLPFYFASSSQAVYVGLSQFFANPFAKLAFLAFVALSLYHAAHRLYHGLHDLHVHGPGPAMLVLFYGGATVLSGICAILLLRLP